MPYHSYSNIFCLQINAGAQPCSDACARAVSDIQQNSRAPAGDHTDLPPAKLMSLRGTQLLATLGRCERYYSS